MTNDKVDILLVDDQPAKLLSYEVILRDLGENLVKAESARAALEQLLKRDIAVVLIDVCMPELDGFQLAAMIRDHPRFRQTAIIFISAIHLTDVDRLRGYEMGAVDYVPVPVIPEVLRAKVKVFAELYRKTRELEQLNRVLEARVAERTAAVESSNARLMQSEQLRTLALAAGRMGTWDWDALANRGTWDEGQYRIFGVEPDRFQVTIENIRALVHPEDWDRLVKAWFEVSQDTQSFQTEFRVRRPNGELRWCIGTAAASVDHRRIVRISGVTVDITDRKEAEERQALLAREVDHRARNALAVVQSIVRLTKASTIEAHVRAVEGRIRALARAHILLSQSRWQGADLGKLVEEEMAPYRTADGGRITVLGPDVMLEPATAQTLALALHELATNAAKYGALSVDGGRLRLGWEVRPGSLVVHWSENGGPAVEAPVNQGYGTRVIGASIERQLGGTATFEWLRDGLQCTLSVPRSDKMKLPGPATTTRPGAREDAGAPPQPVAGNRLLLVEDEALVAMAMKDLLVELGFEVLGAYRRTADALAAARDHDINAALLDVNLGGELIYPVADYLTAKGVPFVFVTGYGAETIDRRFAYVPVLQKPIERRVLENLFVLTVNRRAKSAPRRLDPVGHVAQRRQSTRSRSDATTI
jgi:PAS domain S-box-containing protein